MKETQDTKEAIAEALITLCEKRTFHKISVQDITKKVGLNRQTFYYHFASKYDLLRWVYQKDALVYLTSEVSVNNWEEQTLKMLKAIQNKGDFYHNTVSSDSDVLMKAFFEVTNQLFIKFFEQLDVEKQLLEEDKHFYAMFFSYGCSGVLIKWIIKGYQETPLVIAAQLFRLAKDTELYSYRLYTKEQDN